MIKRLLLPLVLFFGLAVLPSTPAFAYVGDCRKVFNLNNGQAACNVFTNGSGLSARVSCFNTTNGQSSTVNGNWVYDYWHYSTGYCPSGQHPTAISYTVA